MGVGESIGEKLEVIDGQALVPNGGQSTSMVRRSAMLYSDLISSVLSDS